MATRSNPARSRRILLRVIGRRAFVRGRKPLGPFWTLVWIRVAFWLGAAVTLLWAPLRHGVPPFRAYEARTDLIFDTFAQWDSGWYLHIAQHGYDSEASTSFFPLYPLVVRASAEITRSHVVAAVLVSLVAAGLAAGLVSRIARPFVGDGGARDTVLYLALYPVAFVFTSAYSEGLFLALAAGAFLAAMHERPWLAGLLGGLAVDTRLIGIALLPALLYVLWPRSRSVRDLLRPAPLLLLPAALGAYMLYLDRHVGDAFAFQKAQRIYWLRHTPTLGPLGGLWNAVTGGYHGAAEILLHLPRQLGEPRGFPQRDTWATYNVLHLLLLAVALWLTWIVWRRLGPALGLYAVSVQLVLLSATVNVFPLASYPRYLLADFPLFIALASLTRDRPRAREATLVGFAAIGAVAAVAFAHNVWIA
jgi:Mannosyltransferase (PIG-V)